MNRYEDEKTLHSYRCFSAHPKTLLTIYNFRSFEQKTQNFRNYSELWQESLTDELKRPRSQKPELLLQAAKRQTVGHAAGGSKSWAKNSTLEVVLPLKRQSCNNGSILLKKKKKNWQKVPSSLKSEGFENVLMSTKVTTEMCLFGKTSYQSEDTTQHLRRKAAEL